MRARRALLGALALCALVTSASIGAAQGEPPALPAPPLLEPHRAALEIDGEAVPWEEFACWLVRLQGEQHARAFVRHRAVERAALAAGIALTDEELRALVDAQVAERVANAFGGDRDAWRDELARLGQTEEEFYAARIAAARVETWTERLVTSRRTISEEQLRAAWERAYGAGGRRLELRVLHLGLPPADGDPGKTREERQAAQRAAREALEARARSLRERVLAGDDFEALVREHSEDPESRALGGKVPAEFFRRPGWNAALDALGELELGELSEPVFAHGGYNLLRVEGLELTPFESVADELRRELATRPVEAAEVGALFDELTAGVALELLPELARAVDGSGAEPQSWRLDRPIFAVGGEPVTRGEYALWLVAAEGAPLVRSFAEMRIIERMAAAEGVEVSSAEVERRLRHEIEERIELFHRGDRAKWLASIAERNVSEEGHLRMLAMRTRHDLLAERLLLARRVITPEMLRREWESRYGAEGKSPDVRYVERRMRPPAEGEIETQEELDRHVEAERKAALELLAELRARADAGEDFATLARLYSQDPATRELGGRHAGRFELHTWSEDVQQKIRALAPGECTEPLEVGQRFFLFQLVGLAVVPFEEVEAALRDELATSRPSLVEVAGFVNEIYQEHRVRTLPGLYAP